MKHNKVASVKLGTSPWIALRTNTRSRCRNIAFFYLYQMTSNLFHVLKPNKYKLYFAHRTIYELDENKRNIRKQAEKESYVWVVLLLKQLFILLK